MDRAIHVLVWEFRPRAERVAAFERAYASDGTWARLFAKAEGYLGTELLRDRDDAGRYLTVDRWASAEAFDAFRARHAAEYERVDRECEGLTSHERFVGRFEVLG